MNQPHQPISKERVLYRKTTFQGKVVSIDEKTIDFGNGENRVFEVVDWNTLTGVSALPFLNETTVLLIEHFQAGIEKKCLSLPTGGLGRNEDPKERMNIELQEEIGYKSGELTLMYRPHLLPGYLGSEAGYVFIAKKLVPSKLTGDEPFEIRIHEFSLKKTVEMIRSGTIVDSRTISAILYFKTFYT